MRSKKNKLIKVYHKDSKYPSWILEEDIKNKNYRLYSFNLFDSIDIRNKYYGKISWNNDEQRYIYTPSSKISWMDELWISIELLNNMKENRKV